MNCLEWVATGFLYGIAYMVAGLGVARAASAMKHRPMRPFDLFWWPIVLTIIAVTGTVVENEVPQ
jgi:uncharacterized membrane protein YhaH (DUF805 family)